MNTGPNTRLAVTIRFRDGTKLDLPGVITAGPENGCYNVVYADKNGPTSVRRFPLDTISQTEETVVREKPNPADRLFVPRKP